MKIAYRWLLDYLDVQKDGSPVTLPVEEITRILLEVGLEVEEVLPYESVRGGLKGLLTGHVLDVQKHPDADKLSVTRVDLGRGEPVEIVCGAPNVASGQKVIVAPENTTIYPLKGEPFTITRAKIRGVYSHGMICAEDEIGLGTSHDGILVLPPDTPVGLPAADLFNIYTDHIIDIGLTPNRADAMSHIGVARDIMAWLRVHSPYEAALRLPDAPPVPAPKKRLPIAVSVADHSACPRYAGLVYDALQIGPSPTWMQQRLKAIGAKPINNIVDITNYVLHEMGQPLHAFDYDKVRGQEVVVQTLPAGSPFVTLDGDTRKLHPEDLMICDAEGGMCMAGVYGGKGTGVSNATQRIFLEVACFHPASIRKSAVRHNLRTEAAMHFEKGIDPNLADLAMRRTTQLLQDIARATVASDIVDLYPEPVQPVQVSLKLSYAHTLAGEAIPKERIVHILEALDMPVSDKGDTLLVEVPTRKTEVTRPADVMEEVLRIYGYNNLPLPEVMHPAISVHWEGGTHQLRERTLDYLAASGFHECTTLSFVSEALMQKTGLEDEATLAHPANPLSAELDTMRPTLLYTLLQVVAHNLNHKNTNQRLMEFGRAYGKGKNGFTERHELALALTGSYREESWEGATRAVDFFDLKRSVLNLIRQAGLPEPKAAPVDSKHFDYGLKLEHNGKLLASLGAVHPSLLKVYDIKKPVFAAVVYWDAVAEVAITSPVRFAPISRFPTMRRDLALVMDKSVPYERLEAIALATGGGLLREVNLFDVYEDEKLGKGKVSYALSFVLQKPDATLTDQEADRIMQKLMQRFTTELEAQIRQ